MGPFSALREHEKPIKSITSVRWRSPVSTYVFHVFFMDFGALKGA
jgi:hypothetical protein